MKNYKLEEKIVMIPLMYKIVKANFTSDNNIKCKCIKYGENMKQYYRVYEGLDEKKPIIFFIHGGGWWHGSPKMCSYIGKYFSKLGYPVVLPAYRLAPLYKYPTQIEDVFSAFTAYIDSDEDLLRRGVVVIGFSAGGELAANLVFNRKMQEKYKVNPSLFKCLISLSGVLDFEKCTSKHSQRLIKNYLGEDYNLLHNNPVNLINHEIKVKTLCIHGNKDPLIDKENSLSFIERIREFGGDGELYISKGTHHSDIVRLMIEDGGIGSNKILDFIEQYG